MSDKKEWREYLLHEARGQGESNHWQPYPFKKPLPLSGGSMNHIHAIDYSAYQSEKARADALEEENQKLKAALEKIATTEYLAYRQGDTPADHQYKLGVTDGHRLAAQWAKEALK